MSVLVVIVNYRVAAFTLQCLESLIPERERVPGMRVAVIENDSGDAEALREGMADPVFEGWTELLIAERNGGFSYGNNIAVRPMLAATPSDYVLLLNPDTRIRPGAVETLVEFMESHPEAGIAGAGLINGDGSEWPYAFRFPTVLSELDGAMQFGPVAKLLKKYAVAQRMGDSAQLIDWVPGAAMIVRREVFEDAGLMDQSYFLYFEETDFCLAAKRAGWPCWYVPEAKVVHVAGQSTGVTVRDQRPPRRPDYWFESRRRYFMKNHGFLYAATADIAHIGGLAFKRARRKIQGREDDGPPELLGDLWRNSVIWRKNRAIEPPEIT